ncbi:MAG: hypothetical protein JJU00_03610 [Opitutales bacterium]|nr:hypothetical protein [Opitutales bacterium]
MQQRLFFGFAEREVAPEQSALVAGPEKALIDLLYLTPESDDADYLRELRLEWDVPFDDDVFHAGVERTKSRKVARAARRIRELRAEESEYISL